MTVDPGVIGSYIRNWMHYDNLVSSLSKQTTSSRKIRDEYEKKIVSYLEERHMLNAVIQTGNGKLTIVNEHRPKPLSLIRINDILSEYTHTFPNRKCNAEEIMEFIKSKRGVVSSKYIKKHDNGADETKTDKTLHANMIE